MEATSSLPRARSGSRGPGTADLFGGRVVPAMRCVLAISALLITWLDPEPAHFAELTRATAALYVLWCLALFAVAEREPARDWSPAGWWVDVLTAAALIALTRDPASFYFFLFVFAIVVASFSRGYREGLLVTIASVALFVVSGIFTTQANDVQEVQRSLVRAACTFALGWMIAYWGGRELARRKRLHLLREIAEEWSPRIGADRALRSHLGRLLGLFDAKRCILFVSRTPREPVRVYDVSAKRETRYGPPTELSQARTHAVFDLPADLATCHRRGANAGPAALEELADALEAESFATVPYRQSDVVHGRLFIVRGRAFSNQELELVQELMGKVAQAVQNTELTEELALKAAAHERFRISLDIHDTAVQPYIGLKLGLDALSRQAGADNPLRTRIDDLVEMANTIIPGLRGYAAGLRKISPISRDALHATIGEQAKRFSRFYGIDVDVRFDPEARITSHMAGECFCIVAEALTNVLRHTRARHAFVHIGCEGEVLRIAVGNDWTETSQPKFMPRSISLRATQLGGTTSVNVADGYLVVEVRVPA